MPYRCSDFVYDSLADQRTRVLRTIDVDGTTHTTVVPRPRVETSTGRERMTHRFRTAEVERALVTHQTHDVGFTETAQRVPTRQVATHESIRLFSVLKNLPDPKPPRGRGFA